MNLLSQHSSYQSVQWKKEGKLMQRKVLTKPRSNSSLKWIQIWERQDMLCLFAKCLMWSSWYYMSHLYLTLSTRLHRWSLQHLLFSPLPLLLLPLCLSCLCWSCYLAILWCWGCSWLSWQMRSWVFTHRIPQSPKENREGNRRGSEELWMNRNQASKHFVNLFLDWFILENNLNVVLLIFFSGI